MKDGEGMVSGIAAGLYRIMVNYEREGSGPGSRFEGQTAEAAQAEWAISEILAAVAPDIAAQAKRECAEELRAIVEDAAAEPDDELSDSVDYDDRMIDVPPLLRLAESWAGSSRT